MVRVGIIGTNIGASHAAILNQLENAKVLWLCGKNLQKTKEIAKKLGIEKSTDDFQNVIKDPAVDLVIIAVPNYLHKEVFLETLKYNKHIVLEKPAGLNSIEVSEMLDVVKKLNYKKYIVIDHEMRFNPAMQYIKEQIALGSLGKITNVQISKYHGSKDGQGLYENWEVQEKLGGGQVLLVGSHLVDLSLFLLGFPKFIKGTVHKRNIIKIKRTLKNEIIESDTEDFYRSKMQFNDIQVDLFDTIYGDGHKTNEVKITGTKASFIYDDVYGLFISINGKLKKIIIKDKLKNIKSQSNSLINSSLKFFLSSLIDTIDRSIPLHDFCTLEESKIDLECFERCEIV